MPKDRSKTRANKKKEQMLSKRDAFGRLDPTPHEAVKLILQKERGWYSRVRESN